MGQVGLGAKLRFTKTAPAAILDRMKMVPRQPWTDEELKGIAKDFCKALDERCTCEDVPAIYFIKRSGCEKCRETLSTAVVFMVAAGRRAD